MIWDAVDAGFVWFFTFPHWAEYLFIGWLTYGLSIFLKDTNPSNWKGALVASLTTWPIALLLQILVFLHTLAVRIFDPEKGPLSAYLNTFKRALNARVHAIERRPQVPAPPPSPSTAGGKAQ